MGLKQSEHKHAIYQRIQRCNLAHWSICGLSNHYRFVQGHTESFKDKIKTKFQMSDLGLLSFYLGIEVQQHGDGISLCQAHYASRILQLGGMEGCNPAHTLMEERLKLSRESTAKEVTATKYRQIVGSKRGQIWHLLLGS
jgi:hypothetical protein